MTRIVGQRGEPSPIMRLVATSPGAGVDQLPLCFAGYTLDPRRGCLRRGEAEIALRPKSFEVLRYLVEHAGRLVPKDEVVGVVWPRVVVGDESLARCVSEIRAALDDHEQRIIRTMPRRGYIFEAPVSRAPTETAAARETASSAPGARPDVATSPAEPRPDERRQLQVMACKWVGLAALAARLDPEDLQQLLEAGRRHCAQIIERYHGYVARDLDDGFVGYFGYPVASEHAAEHAIRAGLALLGSSRDRDGSLGTPLPLRIGIASGIVVVGEHLAIGGTPTVANALTGLAEVGSLVIAGSTRRLVGGLFDYRDLGGLAVDGSAEQVAAYRVLGTSAIESRFDARQSGALTPLVGREEELELLQRRWRQVREGGGKVVLLSGEPGIGKSRLIAALEEWLKAEAYSALRVFCSPLHTDSALFPVIRLLERTARFNRADPPPQKLAKLAALIEGGAERNRMDVVLLAELLSLPIEDGCRLPEMSPQQRKARTLAALVAQLERMAGRQPVLLIYEDVHWIDPTTRELLELVVDRIARLPVLLILAFRPEFQPPWVGQAHVTSVALGRLARRESMALVAAVAGDKAPAQELIAEIVERADGIPLFVEELTKATLEAATSDDGGTAAPRVPSRGRGVPPTLHDSLVARLDHLGPHAKQIAQIGAVIGREFSYELLVLAARTDDSQLRNAVALLGDSGLVFSRGTPPDATFLFKHALLQDIAYAMLLRDRRRELHGRIATALEERFPDIVLKQPELLARHCTAAELTEKALSYWLTASKQAVIRCAMPEAISQLRKGLDLLASLPDGASTKILATASIRQCSFWAEQMESVIEMTKSPRHKAIALRLRAHALRSAGVMLLQVDPSESGFTLGREEAGQSAGMFIREIKTALVLASLTDARFAELVECEDPPTAE
jgi:DNA-binding winged helix-turn-helix (wHTH) protein